jgi:hypothetical protein
VGSTRDRRSLPLPRRRGRRGTAASPQRRLRRAGAPSVCRCRRGWPAARAGPWRGPGRTRRRPRGRARARRASTVRRGCGWRATTAPAERGRAQSAGISASGALRRAPRTRGDRTRSRVCRAGAACRPRARRCRRPCRARCSTDCPRRPGSGRKGSRRGGASCALVEAAPRVAARGGGHCTCSPSAWFAHTAWPQVHTFIANASATPGDGDVASRRQRSLQNWSASATAQWQIVWAHS